MKLKKPKYSIVIPAYKEAKIIEQSLKTLATYLVSTKIMDVCEVIVVCADAPDHTKVLVSKCASLFWSLKLIEPGKKVGKGRDVRAGIMEARGTYVLFTDADLATPVEHILPAFNVLEEGADVVIGIRELNDIHIGIRKWVSLVANSTSRLLISPSVADTQCGFKGFSARAAKKLFNKQTIMGWAFDMEILFLARKMGFDVRTIGIPDWTENKLPEDQLVGESNLKAAVRTFSEVLQIRWRYLKGAYNLTRKKTVRK